MLRKTHIILLTTLVASTHLSGCYLSARGGHGHAGVIAVPPPVTVVSAPPPHAKAYGHRSRYHYRYYPDTQVYFDTGRGVYFYLDNGSWTMSVRLPDSLRVDLGSGVSLELETDRPYSYFDEHRKKYPGKKKQKRKHKKKHERRDD